MSETPKTPGDSLLSEIISASIGKEKTITDGAGVNGGAGGENNGTNGPKKKREPINPVTFLKGIGAIFLVAIIFFGSFLAYIVLNPDQAEFFIKTFGIDNRNVASILKKLINGSFGIVFLILTTAWIVVLFRAIWTPKELKRRKILSSISALFIGIILFSFIAFWAYLFRILPGINFGNLEGKISIYNNELLNNPATEADALIKDTTNIIGPIDLTFEIGINAAQAERSSFTTIYEYEINFDGAICNDGTSVSKGSDPKNVKGIVCTFDRIKPYNIQGFYRGTGRNGKIEEIQMVISPVEIRGLIGIKKQKNRNSEDIITLDATDLVDLGNPRWRYVSNDKEEASSSITMKVTDIPQVIEFKLFNEAVDRIFVIKRTREEGFTGSIIVNQSVGNPLRYTFSIEGLNIDETGIIAIDWRLSDGTRMCTDGSSMTCEYTFSKYNSYTITANIETANNENYKIEQNLKLKSPLNIVQKAKVKDESGNILNTDDTYNVAQRAYIIKGIETPTKIYFDAQDVVTEDPEYRLSKVIWKMSDGEKTEEKEGTEQEFDLSNPVRYTMNIEYIFRPNVGGKKEDEKSSKDTIIFDIEHKSLIPKFSIEEHSDYVPVVIEVDGSASDVEKGEIKKFTYTFGEGKAPVDGDAIQRYEYKEAGEKTITLTITNERGESATTKQTIVLKNNPRTIDFNPSLPEGYVGRTINFIPTSNGGDISDYIWTFGDNSPTSKSPEASHIYKETGKYIVKLTVVYNDGTRKSTEKQITVISE